MDNLNIGAHKLFQFVCNAGAFIAGNSVKAGRQLGTKILDGYQMIDPDVSRHLAHLPILSYSLFVPRHVEITPGKPDGHPPLIFVHGLGGDRGNFLLMAKYLWLTGRKRSYRVHFDPENSTLEMSEYLADYIKQVLEITGEPQVEIVAHSFGGIISRLTIANYKLEPFIRTLITLGTPHNGTYPARFANTEKTISLRPQSDIIKSLKNLPWPKNVKGFTFWSNNDLLVLPAESAMVDGTITIDMTPFTHFSYLFDPRSWIEVERSLFSVHRMSTLASTV